ncbi:unnamed protein product [marine sediment metagenome]|uniref:DksA C4-type domain-containing protein n=1 Tax=marine sediment metagenome TaxID=412755 RepID=X1H8N4_9ZZZZ
MSNEEDLDNGAKTAICCVKNCQKEIPIDKAIVINGQNFCGICGTAYYRSALNL